MLEVTNLTFAYKQQQILQNISFKLNYGQSVCLLGKNGVGKSTLFKCLLRVLQPSAGNIKINDRPIQACSRNELSQLISYIPQKQRGVFHFTVFEMVLMGTTARLKKYQQPGQMENDLANAALATLHISHLKDQIYSQISGGEQQLVIIARSVAQQSRIIIMDEPCANLDYGNQIMVLEMIHQLTAEGFLIIQSTHDPNHALQYADHVMILQKGQLTNQGRPEEILTSQQLESIYQVPITVHEVTSGEKKICLPTKNRKDAY
ncbi:ABC transporter ATP-binding protein [Enterococcus crotali]|uniref:ABC transporter ATP-binding protein n=1 Tax=Enterococcus crotali TaxID=1453587 RepID=UPI0004706F21|nr:ABC transporter ATP-binding protein [Enterococcus crotali]